MSFFNDDVYENLDWLSQATTPLVFSGNAMLSELPSRIDVSQDDIRKALGGYGFHLESYITNMLGCDYDIPGNFYNMIKNCYRFVGEGDMTIDPAHNIYPTIHVEKVKQSFSEKEIIQFVKDKLRYINGQDIGRINEILDLIDYRPEKGHQNIRNSRSVRKKIRCISSTLGDIFSSNKWEVRDADLMLSFVDWVNLYIEKGNLAALTNITKLKVMTHRKQPIYSIKEMT